MIGAWKPIEMAVPAVEARVNRSDPATLLFVGDLHMDHPAADRAAIRRVLSEAVERKAAIVLLGDVFDLMQGRNDRRSGKSALREQYAGRDDYLLAALEDVSAFLRPFARNIWLLLEGNHETAITKYNEVNMTRLLAHELRREGSECVAPGYQTYAVARPFATVTNGERIPFWVAHGHGGGGEVTRGTIQAQRRAATYPDARFLVSGHIHKSWFVPHDQYRIRRQTGETFVREQEHYSVGSAKDEFSLGRGYHVEAGRGPTTFSGWWCEFKRARGTTVAGEDRYEFWFTRAKP